MPSRITCNHNTRNISNPWHRYCTYIRKILKYDWTPLWWREYKAHLDSDMGHQAKLIPVRVAYWYWCWCWYERIEFVICHLLGRRKMKYGRTGPGTFLAEWSRTCYWKYDAGDPCHVTENLRKLFSNRAFFFVCVFTAFTSPPHAVDDRTASP